MKRRILAALLLVGMLCSFFVGCQSDSTGTAVTTDGNSDTVASTENRETEGITTAGQETDPPETEIPVSFPPYEGGEVVLRFLLTSDTHITSSSPVNQASRRVRKMINMTYAYAKTQTYAGLDAVVVVGDLTDNGREKEYTAFNKIMADEIREGTELITVSGNHEYFQGSTDAYRDNINADFHVDVTIKDYHFIGVSCTNSAGSIDEAGLSFLREAVTGAIAADPEKPIITFQHHPVRNTVYMSVAAADYSPVSAQLKEIYSLSSRVVNFSGHTHAPVNHPRAIWQDTYTAFGNGTTTYICHENELLRPQECGSTLYSDADQFTIVEITADNRVRILPFNMMTEEFFRVPGTDTQLTYEIDVNNPDSWENTIFDQATSEAPVFAEDAVITVNRDTADNVISISFPQATDEEGVYCYSFLCTGTDGFRKSGNYTSGYFVEPMPETLSIPLRGELKKGETYTVTVKPIDGFSNGGRELTVTFVA